MKTTLRRLAGLGALLLAALAFATGDMAPPAAGLHADARDQRNPEQTFLTYPEWFLVFSPDEYASLLQTRSSSDFPWFRHIGQFWSGYGKVIEATRQYPFNSEYHTMIVVIGTSTTVEFGIKGAYETLVGRLTEFTAPINATPEDQLAARQAQDYVDFIRVRPWYEFDFAARLKQLWTQTPMTGPHLLRKWERRYLLTSEWTIKAIYGWALGTATQSTFAAPLETTVAVVQGLPNEAGAMLPSLRRLRANGDETLVELPRYHAFTGAATALAERGVRFVEIAGNRGDILVSSVMPVATADIPGVRVMIRQPILTRPGYERRVLQVPVARLGDVLASSARNGLAVEHVFDY